MSALVDTGVGVAPKPRRLAQVPVAPGSRGQDAAALLLVALFTAVLAALTWKTWGNPQTTNELSIAELIASGGTPYEDVRYYYGPAGLYGLAGAFKVFGASFTTAFAFGFAVTAAILATFYALSRHWLEPLPAGLVTAALAAVALTGTEAGYPLPHTNSATVGLLFLLLELLALARGRPVLAGLAIGVVGLTRPELAAAALVAAAAYLAGLMRAGGLRGAGRPALTLGLPAAAVVVAGFAPFAAAVGVPHLVTENVFPLDFIRASGLHVQKDWAPFSAVSGVALAARTVVYVALAGGFIASVVLWRRARGGERLRAIWPLAAAGAVFVVLEAASRAFDLFPGTRAVVQTEVLNFQIGMSWLPALALAAALAAVVAARRGKAAPLSGSWPLDLALIGVAALLALRTYNRFIPDVYAAYYVAPFLVIAGVLHQRVGERWPAAKGAAMAALAAVAAGLAVNAVTGESADETRTVQTARGSYATTQALGDPLQQTVDFLRENTRPGELLVDLPNDSVIYFAAEMRPALYDSFVFPGTLEGAGEEGDAIVRLRKHRPRFVVLGNGRFVAWGKPRIGVDFNRRLIAAVRRDYRPRVTFGSFADAPSSHSSTAFRVFERR